MAEAKTPKQAKLPLPKEFKIPLEQKLDRLSKFKPPVPPIGSATTFLFRADDPPVEQSDVTSYLGSAIHSQVVIQPGRYFELSDIKGESPIDYEGIVMPAVLVDVSMTKNIVKTSIQGRHGTVKEFVSDGDFIVTITGNVMGQTTEGGQVGGTPVGSTVDDIGPVYPEIDTRRLAEICKVPNSIRIECKFLQMFASTEHPMNDFVITDYKFAEREGFRNMQPFQITLLSDVAIELEELANE